MPAWRGLHHVLHAAVGAPALGTFWRRWWRALVHPRGPEGTHRAAAFQSCGPAQLRDGEGVGQGEASSALQQPSSSLRESMASSTHSPHNVGAAVCLQADPTTTTKLLYVPRTSPNQSRYDGKVVIPGPRCTSNTFPSSTHNDTHSLNGEPAWRQEESKYHRQ